MIINRSWAMPNKDTFSIKPIKELIGKYIEKENYNLDPFVRNSPFKHLCVSNDLDKSINADYHMDALDFLKAQVSDTANLILFDPPYSPRQVSECYKKLDMTVNMQTTQSSFWSNMKNEIGRLVKEDGIVMTFGWNSGGIGIKNGFEIVEILLVAHGGWHNDTIVTVEKKQKSLNMELF